MRVSVEALNHLTPAQIRGARGLLNWCMVDLARAAGVSVSTVKRMEMHDPQPVSDGIRTDVQGAFEKAGVRFLDDGSQGIGFQPR